MSAPVLGLGQTGPRAATTGRRHAYTKTQGIMHGTWRVPRGASVCVVCIMAELRISPCQMPAGISAQLFVSYLVIQACTISSTPLQPSLSHRPPRAVCHLPTASRLIASEPCSLCAPTTSSSVLPWIGSAHASYNAIYCTLESESAKRPLPVRTHARVRCVWTC